MRRLNTILITFILTVTALFMGGVTFKLVSSSQPHGDSTSLPALPTIVPITPYPTPRIIDSSDSGLNNLLIKLNDQKQSLDRQILELEKLDYNRE